jgi:disulfide bond formation protein DsbB
LRLNSTFAQPEAYRLGAVALMVALAAILTALGFEYIGGHAPCPLCLTERYAYYVGVPLLFAALVALAGGHPVIAAAGFFLVALAFLANMGVGAYHAGAEWGFWPGPSTCSGALQPLGSPADLLKGLKTVTVIRCDQAGWRLFGLSFAGWNAVISTGLWITSWLAGRAALRGCPTNDSQKFR